MPYVYENMSGRKVELRADRKTQCDVIDCTELAVCLLGCGSGHPSCEKHIPGTSPDYVSPLPAFWTETGDKAEPAYRMRRCSFCSNMRPSKPEAEKVGRMFICEECAGE